MQMSKGRRAARRVLMLTAAISGISGGIFNPASQQASATTYYWDTGSDIFQTTNDWTTDPTGSTVTGSAIPGSGDTAVFNGSSDNQSETISLNSATPVGGLVFQNTGSTSIVSSSSTSEALTIGASGIVIASGAGQVTLGDPTNANPITIALSGSQSWTNNSSSLFSIADALSLGSSALTLSAGTGGITISAPISGTGSLSLTGGTLTLSSATSTYTGTTSISGGTLRVGNVVVSSGASGLGNATSAVALSGGGILSYTGSTATYTRGFTIGSGGGEVDVTTSGQTLTSNTTLSLANGGFTVGGAGNLTISTTTTTALSGTNTLTKNGTGTFEISNTTVDNISGAMPIVINAGTFITNISTKETTLTNPLGTGQITMTPTTTSTGTILEFEMGAGTYTVPNGFVINNSSNGTAEIWNESGLLTYSGSITAGSGSATPTLNLANNNNTAGSYSTFTGGITGQLNVEFDGYGNGSPINVTTNAINNSGTITNIGTNAAGIATISAAIGSNVTAITQAGAAPFTISSAYTLSNTVNSFTSTGSGLFTFSGGLTGAQDLTFYANGAGPIAITTNSPNNSGHIYNSGSGSGITTISAPIGANVVGVVEYSGTSALVLTGNNSNTPSLPLTAVGGVLDVYYTNSLPGYPTPAVGQITVNSPATFAVGYGAPGQFTYTDIANILNGTLPISFSYGSALGLDTTSGSTTLPNVLTDFTGGPSQGVPLNLSKVGTNTLTLTGANTYTGNTIIQQGVLSAVPGVGLPSGSLLVINAGAANGVSAASFSPPSGSFTLPLGTSAGDVELTGGNSGFTALNLPTTINLGGAAAPITWGSSGFNPTGLLLNDAVAGNTVNFVNPINLGNNVQSVVVNSTAFAGTLSGQLSDNGGGGLNKSGAGTLYVTNSSNSYSGPSNVTAGTLVFKGAGTLPSTGPVGITAANTLEILNDGSGSNGTISQGNQVNILTSSNTAPYATLFVGPNTSNNTGNTIAMGLLNNQYNNANVGFMNFTAANGYLISFTGIALPNTTGNNTELYPLTTSLIINGNVTNAGTGGTGNYDTLYFMGTSAGNQINGTISDAPYGSVTVGNYTRLAVEGANTVTLNGNSTYTGGTFVGNNSAYNTGVLIVNGSLGGTLVTVQGGGTLGGKGVIGDGTASLQATQGSVVVDGGATAGTQGTISLVDGTIGTLTIQGNSYYNTSNQPPAQSLTLGGTGAGTVSIIDLETNGSANDQITLSGGNSNKLTLQAGGAVINLVPIGGATLGPGTYPLINFAAGGTYTGSFTLGSVPLPSGEVATLSALNSTSTAESLIVSTGTTAGAVNAYWKGGVSTVWNAGLGGTSTNFTSDYAGTTQIGVPDLKTNVFFASSSASTSSLSATLGQGFAINSLSFVGSSPSAGTASTIASPAPLTINAASGFTDQNGNGYQAGTGIVVQSGVTVADTISAPLVLGGSQSWNNNGTGTLTLSGGVNGTGNLTLNNNSSGPMTISTNPVNHAGTITNNGTGSGLATISGGVGPNVTAINENTTTSALTISTTALTVNANGTTLTNNEGGAAAAFTGLTVSGGVNGTGNLILNTNSNGNITFITTAVNPAGAIINSGSGTTGPITNAHTSALQLALVDIDIALGANVTGVFQNSPSSDLILAGVNSSYTNGITINAGELDISNSGSSTCTAMGAATNVVKLGTGTANAILNYNARVTDAAGGTTTGSGNATVAGQIVVGGSGLDVIQTSDYTPTFTGQVTLLNNLTIALPNSGGGSVIFTGGIVGTGNITVSSESTGGSASYPNVAQFTTNPVNNSGTITYNNSSVAGGPAGTGANAYTNIITGGVGPNVTGIIQASYNPLTISTSPLTVNPNGTTLTQAGVADTAGAFPLFTVSGGVIGNGNLILNNNSTAAGLTLSTTSINNLGTITNSGSGAAGTTISAVIGTNVTGVVQNSSSSTLTLSGTNLYSSGTNITAGTLLANTPSGGSSTGTGPVAVGTSGILGGTGFITGTNAVVGVSGTITAGNGATATSTQGLLTTTGGAATGGAATSSQIWNGNGNYAWKFTSATPNSAPSSGTTDPSGAGKSWDMLSMTSLSIQSTSGSPFVINPVSLGSASLSGSNPYTIADITSGNVTIGNTTANYSSNAPGLASAIQNLVVLSPSYSSSGYTVSAVPDGASGDDIVVVYSAAPEPTSLAFAAVAAGGLMLRRRRRVARS